MLSKPKDGWTDVTVGDFKGVGSYTTDVPIDVLNAFINALKYSIPASVYFDEEGSEFTLVSYYEDTYIIIERKDRELVHLNIDFFDLAKEVVKDIEDYLDDWVNWMCFYDMSETEIAKRRESILTKINKLKKLIENKGGCF